MKFRNLENMTETTESGMTPESMFCKNKFDTFYLILTCANNVNDREATFLFSSSSWDEEFGGVSQFNVILVKKKENVFTGGLRLSIVLTHPV